MKTQLRLFTLLSLLLALSVFKTQGQIMTNGGFESWGLQGLYMSPSGWITNNGIPAEPIVGQGPAHSGNYSARLMSDTLMGSYIGGQVTLHYTGSVKPLAVSGYWKGTMANIGDEVAGELYVYDASFNFIGVGSDYIYTTLSNWTPFNLIVNYTSGNAAVSTDIIITLFCTGPGSDADLDDLTMTYVTSTNDLITAHLPSAVMMPVLSTNNYKLYADVMSNAPLHIEVLNINGAKIYDYDEAGFTGHHEINIPADRFGNGMYICHVTGAGLESSLKFMCTK
ncbi:MAG: hypothetical protein ABI723_05395 [Bacteroidia bacterium]